MKITKSKEDYLEAIYVLSQKNDIVRVTDISNYLQVQKPSTNSAIKTLAEEELVIYEKYKHVELTQKGRAVAKHISKRNELFKKFLTDILQVEPELAKQEADSLSHCVSCHTTAKLEKFIETILQNEE